MAADEALLAAPPSARRPTRGCTRVEHSFFVMAGLRPGHRRLSCATLSGRGCPASQTSYAVCAKQTAMARHDEEKGMLHHAPQRQGLRRHRSGEWHRRGGRARANPSKLAGPCWVVHEDAERGYLDKYFTGWLDLRNFKMLDYAALASPTPHRLHRRCPSGR
jgi:hypothetical protein